MENRRKKAKQTVSKLARGAHYAEIYFISCAT